MTDNKKNTEKTSPEQSKGPINQGKSDSKELSKSSQDKISQTTPSKDKQTKSSEKVTKNKKETTRKSSKSKRTTKSIKPEVKDKIESKKQKKVEVGKSKKTDKHIVKDKDVASSDNIIDSNYQINLKDENSLKIKVITEKAISVDCSVKDRKGKSIDANETQSNKILIHPKSDLQQQEVEIAILIDPESGKIQPKISKESGATEKEVTTKAKLRDSNYQISLTDENLLNIKVTTDKAVSVECSVKDMKGLSGDVSETKLNKILIHPKSDFHQQEVEITISIDSKTDKIHIKEGQVVKPAEKESQESILIPNPEVANLIDKGEFVYEQEESPKTPDEILQEKLGRKNPYIIFRRVYQRNLLRGIIGALIIYIISVFVFYGVASKETNDFSQNNQRRLIVIQDLPEPKIKLKNVEDPMKPDEEVTSESDIQLRKLPPPKRNFKKTTIKRPYDNPQVDTSNISSTNDELDSLRKLNAGTLDSLGLDSLSGNYLIPDSLRRNFSEDDIGLRMYFPNNWKLTDQRDINKNEKEFKGVLLTDTTAKQEGTLTLFIFLDREGKDYRKDDFTTEFKMEDTTLTAFSKEPRNIAGFTEYKFYIFGKTEKLSATAQVRKQYFEEYKNVIEAVVRSIKIEKPNSL